MNVTRMRLITFDVTNTLLKFRSEPGREYGEIGAMYGVLCDRDTLVRNFKAHYVKMSQEHPNFGLRTGLGWETWWKMVISGTFKDTNFDIVERKLDAVTTHLIDLYKTSACWQHCYGAHGLLSYLKSKNIPLGCISNFDPRLSTILKNTKLKDFFAFTLSSYEVGHEKPDTKIFEKAMNESGLKDLKPEDCLHIGNTVTYDYDGATNAGWNPLLIHDMTPEKLISMYPQLDGDRIYRSLYDYHKALILKNEPQLVSKLKETYLQ